MGDLKPLRGPLARACATNAPLPADGHVPPICRSREDGGPGWLSPWGRDRKTTTTGARIEISQFQALFYPYC